MRQGMKRVSGMIIALLLSANVLAANPRVEISTNMGRITAELYPDKAPKTVENFLEYVKSGYFGGTIFHRVIARFMIQGGGFTREFVQKPTREPVANEAANGLKNETGTLAMARTRKPDSATSQFFVNVADNAFLNYTAPTVQGYGYTVFGKVVEGMDIVMKISQLPTGPGGPFQGDVPQQEVIIENVKILETK
jgi:cyclophilin family peptidyl-prolyl cis-trans isomerase